MKNRDFFEEVENHPERFYIIHYSSQSLFDAEAGEHSPRITSVVVRHYQSGQTVSFATHTSAEILGIDPADIEAKYDQVEKDLLTKFYDFARDRRERYWVHWNMRNVVFGFEHLEHRYRKLTGLEPPSIPVEVRVNLNDVLKRRYGEDYVGDPRMPTLMDLNGDRVQGFLTGKEESEAFKNKDFIRMNNSTIAKVGFFSYVISASIKGKLKTAGKGFANWVDRTLASRRARITALIGAAFGLLVAIIQLGLWSVDGWHAVRPAQQSGAPQVAKQSQAANKAPEPSVESTAVGNAVAARSNSSGQQRH
jgi:hypothetical protein